MEEFVCSNQVSDKTHILHLADTFLKSLNLEGSPPCLLFAYFIIITTPVYSFTLQGIQLSPVLSYWGGYSQDSIIRGLLMNATWNQRDCHLLVILISKNCLYLELVYQIQELSVCVWSWCWVLEESSLSSFWTIQGSLVYCSPWGLKESDPTEQLNWLNNYKDEEPSKCYFRWYPPWLFVSRLPGTLFLCCITGA